MGGGCSFPDAGVLLDASQILWNRLRLIGVHNYDSRRLQRAVALAKSGAGRRVAAMP